MILKLCFAQFGCCKIKGRLNATFLVFDLLGLWRIDRFLQSSHHLSYFWYYKP
ncbi:hypothetical protein [Vibrio gallaecicus]|uniref:hypothetical protein n=1 Tax=Vibrio gallaecicus TaxID=552386 RepID=UPI0025B44F0A|nr:hypothetical protein [Vibrio gallaecicus]MDN3613790.1 hypothetical protein [Vibrio gallaecicus]